MENIFDFDLCFLGVCDKDLVCSAEFDREEFGTTYFSGYADVATVIGDISICVTYGVDTAEVDALLDDGCDLSALDWDAAEREYMVSEEVYNSIVAGMGRSHRV